MAAHPGPSNYYQHYAYGSHSPGPAPAPYQYQFPLPPHMHPPPPRPPTYQNYHHPYPQPHSYTPPPPPQPKYPHPQPQHQAYSPSFAPWHPQQPLSPLPKQLSMLPPPTQPPAQEVSIPPQRTHVGSVNTAPSRPESPAHHPHTPGIWVIWSKRPSDPAAAPGIIISPRARPPSDVVHSALALPSPPPSPEPPAPKPELSREDHGLGKDHEAPSSATTATTDTATTATTTTPASSTAPDTPVPGSPLSTNTSLSLSAAVPKAERAPAEDKGAVPAEDKVAISAEDKVPISAEAQAVPVDEKSEAPSASDNAETAAAVDTPKPAPAPAPKKSWASLLRPSSPNSPKNPNSLPTSSVLGFSIPAESSLSSSLSPSAFPSSSSLNPNASPNAHALLALLSGTSNALGNLNVNGAPPLIRPRGLVNSGNMCFANAVLQVLVYCPPFARFFDALGALVGDGGFPSIAVDGGSEEGRSKTPLVDATVRFLREFRPRPSVSTSSSASPFASGSGSGNGSGSGSGNGKGKGVDRYAGAGERYDDDDALGLDSFVPTYVYDALRGEKRFDHMRGGHQEDAEEFLGFYLDTLEEELLALAASVEPSHESAPAAAVVGHGGQLQLQGHGVAAGQGAGQGQATEDQGWLEVGKRNRAVLTRTTKSADSPITRIFGGKFRSTLRVPHQKDSAVVEDWRALRLDIQREQIHTIRDALAFISAPQPVQVTSP
ncbi:UCH-domain-containing protein, partial [Leucogyrophana mollusca]